MKIRMIQDCLLVDEDEKIEFHGKIYDSLSNPADTIKGSSANGWRFFAINEPSGTRLSELRTKYKELVGLEDSDESADDESEDEE